MNNKFLQKFAVSKRLVSLWKDLILHCSKSYMVRLKQQRQPFSELAPTITKQQLSD